MNDQTRSCFSELAKLRWGEPASPKMTEEVADDLKKFGQVGCQIEGNTLSFARPDFNQGERRALPESLFPAGPSLGRGSATPTNNKIIKAS